MNVSTMGVSDGSNDEGNTYIRYGIRDKLWALRLTLELSSECLGI